METIGGVRTFAWNPYKRLGKGRLSSRIPTGQRLSNFGDLMGPILVKRLLFPDQQLQMKSAPFGRNSKLLSVGSILHFAQPGDVVWGSGINGKIRPHSRQLKALDVRSVRGPLTAAYLRKQGVGVPEAFGDPGLLLPILFPVVNYWAKNKKRHALAVPNLNDIDLWHCRKDVTLLDPRSKFWNCIRTIAESEVIVASSLHALVVADALGIPTVPVLSTTEPIFKYQDYYEGTGRAMPAFAQSLQEALRMSAHSPMDPINPITFKAILDSFPWDLWELSGRCDVA